MSLQFSMRWRPSPCELSHAQSVLVEEAHFECMGACGTSSILSLIAPGKMQRNGAVAQHHLAHHSNRKTYTVVVVGPASHYFCAMPAWHGLYRRDTMQDRTVHCKHLRRKAICVDEDQPLSSEAGSTVVINPLLRLCVPAALQFCHRSRSRGLARHG